MCSKRPVGLLHPQILAETGPSPGFQPRSVRPAPESGDLPMSPPGTGQRQRAHDRSYLIPAKGVWQPQPFRLCHITKKTEPTVRQEANTIWLFTLSPPICQPRTRPITGTTYS